jgi:hypothetical protein
VAVVATGNHFLIDVAAGLVLTGVGFGVGLLLRGRQALSGGRQGRRLLRADPTRGGSMIHARGPASDRALAAGEGRR